MISYINTNTFFPMRWRKKKLPSLGAFTTFVIVFMALCRLEETPTTPWIQTMLDLHHSNSNHQEGGRRNERTLPHQNDQPECTIVPAIVPPHKVESTFLASYPGSGSKLSWLLTQALTGMATTDDVFSNGIRNAVGIKTHYPAKEGQETPGSEMIKRVILFVRHPRDAMIAYHDFIYASNNKNNNQNKASSSQHWIRWRDENYEEQIQIWRKHLEYWMDRYSEHHRLIVPYEQIISELHGPTISSHMAEFLSRNQGVSTVKPENIPCLWKTIVQSNFGSNGLRRRRRRRRRRRLTSSSLLLRGSSHNTDYTIMNGNYNSHRQLQQKPGRIEKILEHQQHPIRPPQNPEGELQSQQHMPDTNIKVLPSGVAVASSMMDIYSRPFIEKQVKEMVVALAQLLEKYRDDKVLAPILVKYIDQVTVNTNGDQITYKS